VYSVCVTVFHKFFDPVNIDTTTHTLYTVCVIVYSSGQYSRGQRINGEGVSAYSMCVCVCHDVCGVLSESL